MLVAGFPMHRIKASDPLRDTHRMIAALAPIHGRVLDTATGLGYTAIELARSAASVLTIELDPAAQEIARRNPWSRELFANARIEQRTGDACQVVPTLADGTFERVLHDPPTFALAGELYSEEFYRELYRVLKRGGKLFHYIGDPNSKSGRSVTRGVMARLKYVGFAGVAKREQAFGIIASKT
jgi:predicted methyltransferase